MANYNLKNITESSWIAETNGFPIAIIHRGPEGFRFMTPEASQLFESMQAIKDFLGGNVKEQMQEATQGLNSTELESIEGFPVKHANIIVEQAGERPVYVRGKTQHVAGYWCIKFSKRWVPSFCPLLRTIEQYQATGPFKDRMGMMAELGSLNRQI